MNFSASELNNRILSCVPFHMTSSRGSGFARESFSQGEVAAKEGNPIACVEAETTIGSISTE